MNSVQSDPEKEPPKTSEDGDEAPASQPEVLRDQGHRQYPDTPSQAEGERETIEDNLRHKKLDDEK